jgi:hypothetical protein
MPKIQWTDREGEYPKTFLLAGQAAKGKKL